MREKERERERETERERDRQTDIQTETETEKERKGGEGAVFRQAEKRTGWLGSNLTPRCLSWKWNPWLLYCLIESSDSKRGRARALGVLN